MMHVRSILFVVLFNLSTFLQMLFWTPVFFFLPREDGWKVVKSWAWNSLWLQHLLIGTRFEFRGMEHLPKEGGWIFAAKHQSTWETFSMLPFNVDPTYVVKRELMLIPFFGWFAWKMDIISVNRGKRNEALRSMTAQAERQYGLGRQITIYPEGTRKRAYDPPAYKFGITHMYSSINARVIPVALNSGLFWPRNSFRLYKGTLIMEFLPVIEPGLDAETFSKRLQSAIEEKTAELLAEAETDPEFDGRGRFSSID